ncbi:serine-rich adhesin for platelets-like isoform X2 [Lucilia sericata]|nr:serine-rich adhesin for platelets-like isoform X2 [Lucilia sericata]
MRKNPAAAGEILNFPNLKLNEIVKEEQPRYQPKEEEKATPLKTKARVLNNPQYACFLRETTAPTPTVKKPVQRSRSNEFQKTFSTFNVSASVARSNSLRNLETGSKTTTTSDATSLYFSPEVNSHDKLNPTFSFTTTSQPVNPNAKARLSSFLVKNQESQERTQSLNNLIEKPQTNCDQRSTFSKSQEIFRELTKSQEIFKTNKENPIIPENLPKNKQDLTKVTSKSNKINKTQINSQENFLENENSLKILENSLKISENIDNSQKFAMNSNNETKIHLNNKEFQEDSKQLTKINKNLENVSTTSTLTDFNPLATLDYQVNNSNTNLAALSNVNKQMKENLCETIQIGKNLTEIQSKNTNFKENSSELTEVDYKLKNLDIHLPKNQESLMDCQNLTKSLEISKKSQELLSTLSNLEESRDLNENLNENFSNFIDKLKESIDRLETTDKFVFETNKSDKQFENCKKSVESLDLTFNANYLTDIELKIKENYPARQIKKLNLNNKDKTPDSSILKGNNDNLKEDAKKLSGNETYKTLEVLDTLENSLENSANLSLKEESISKQNASQTFTPKSEIENEISQILMNSSTPKEFKSKSVNHIDLIDENLTQNSLEFTQSLNNLQTLEINEYLAKDFANSVNNIECFPVNSNSVNNIESLDYSKDLTVVYIDDCEYLYQNHTKSLENFKETKDFPRNETKSLENFKTEALIFENIEETNENIETANNFNKNPQTKQSMVTLDDFNCMASPEIEMSISNTNLAALSNENKEITEKFTDSSIKNKTPDNSLDSSAEEQIKSEYDLENIENLTPARFESKSVQLKPLHAISLDSLEADETNEQTICVELDEGEVSSIVIQDVDIELEGCSPYDFNSLLHLKKSKTSYCLQQLEKSFSEESQSLDSTLGNEEFNYITACNTLPSKWSFKPAEIVPSPLATKQKIAPKKPKTLRVKTTEKLLNFTSMASHNVSTYASFRKSKNFYKNASKSFKNSLKFYETFSESNSCTQTCPLSPVKRSLSLPENQIKMAEINRKLFAKTGKIKMKLRNSNEWQSATEKSQSFDFFDKVGDQNGKLGKRGRIGDIADLEKIENFMEFFKETAKLKEILDSKESLVNHDPNEAEVPNATLENENLEATSCKDSNMEPEILLSEKSLKLKPLYKEATFNTSPQPFEVNYEITTFVGAEERELEEISSLSDLKAPGEFHCESNSDLNKSTQISSKITSVSSLESEETTSLDKLKDPGDLTSDFNKTLETAEESFTNSETLKESCCFEKNETFFANDVDNKEGTSTTLAASIGTQTGCLEEKCSSKIQTVTTFSVNASYLKEKAAFSTKLSNSESLNTSVSNASQGSPLIPTTSGKNTHNPKPESHANSSEISAAIKQRILRTNRLRANATCETDADEISQRFAKKSGSNVALKVENFNKNSVNSQKFEKFNENTLKYSSLTNEYKNGNASFEFPENSLKSLQNSQHSKSLENIKISENLLNSPEILGEKIETGFRNYAQANPVNRNEFPNATLKSPISPVSKNLTSFVETFVTNVDTSSIDSLNIDSQTFADSSLKTFTKSPQNTQTYGNLDNILKESVENIEINDSPGLSAPSPEFPHIITKSPQNSQNCEYFSNLHENSLENKEFCSKNNSLIVNALQFPKPFSKSPQNFQISENISNLPEISFKKVKISSKSDDFDVNSLNAPKKSTSINSPKSPQNSQNCENSLNIPKIPLKKTEISSTNNTFITNAFEFPKISSKSPKKSQISENISNLPEISFKKVTTSSASDNFNVCPSKFPKSAYNTENYVNSITKFPQNSQNCGNFSNIPEIPFKKQENSSKSDSFIYNSLEFPKLPSKSRRNSQISANYSNSNAISATKAQTCSTNVPFMANSLEYSKSSSKSPHNSQFSGNYSYSSVISAKSSQSCENLTNFPQFSKNLTKSSGNSQNFCNFPVIVNESSLVFRDSKESSISQNLPIFSIANNEKISVTSFNTLPTPFYGDVFKNSHKFVTDSCTKENLTNSIQTITDFHKSALKTNKIAQGSQSYGNSEQIISAKALNTLYKASLTSLEEDTTSTYLGYNHSFNYPTPQFLSKSHLNLKTKFSITPTTTTKTTTPTPFTMVKDLKETTTTEIATTFTATTTTTTNFPTKVVALSNLKPTNISYANSSFSSSSLRYTNKAKYQQNTTTTTTTTATTFTPAPPLKVQATTATTTTIKNPPKVLPRRLYNNNNAPKLAKTTMISYSSNSTITSSSITTNTTCFKTTSTTTTTPSTCNAPLRRRIPGNTLYYV